MSEMMMTALKEIFKFPLKQEDRNSFVTGAVLTVANFFVPIVPALFVSGYTLQIMRQAIEGKELRLPAWNDWGKLAIDGLRATVVGLVYMLPGIVIFYGGMGLYLISSLVFPIIAAASPENEQAIVLAVLIFFGGMGLMFVSVFLGLTLFMIGLIPLPVAMTHFVAQDKVGAAFRLGEVWALLRANPLGYLIAWVIVAGLLGVTYFLILLAYYSVILCCLVPFVAAPIGFYVSLVSAAVFGQTYRESKALLAAQAR